MCKAGANKEVARTVAPAAGEDSMIHGTDPSQYKRPTTYGDDFHWVGTDEPHATRRKLIVEKYPQIKELFGHCPRTKFVVAFVVTLQTFLAYQAPYMSWPVFLATAYIIGGTSNHCMMMAMHELSHNLGFKKMLHNRICGLIANLPVLIPSAISFKRYHMEHHRYQGEEGIDVDLPTNLEGRIFNNVFSKTLFVIFQVLFYAFRPLYVNPKKPGVWELYNWIACLSYVAFIYAIAGYNGLGYLLTSSLMGSGAHPVAGHFIAEHYVFILGYETYSYYGILNLFTFNVGCHNEHHDFPYIPGSRLHKVREIAPEFYENLPQHDSWVKVIYDYITDPAIGAFSRVKRHTLTDADKNKLKSD